MNIKRYIDMAVRKQVRRILHKDSFKQALITVKKLERFCKIKDLEYQLDDAYRLERAIRAMDGRAILSALSELRNAVRYAEISYPDKMEFQLYLNKIDSDVHSGEDWNTTLLLKYK